MLPQLPERTEPGPDASPIPLRAIPPRIVLAGLPAETALQFASLVDGAEVVILQSLAGSDQAGDLAADFNLLVINDGFNGGQAADWLATLRLRTANSAAPPGALPSAAPKLIYCLSPDAGGPLVRHLIVDLGVDEILFQPVEAETLAKCAAGLLQLEVASSAASVASSDGEEIRARLAAAWRSVNSRMFDRLGVLEKAAAELQTGRLSRDLRRKAHGEAHKLAGSLGTFGVAAGSRFALQIEQWLERISPLDHVRVRRFAELTGALRVELERASAGFDSATAPVEPRLRPALLVCADSELSTRLREEAAARDWAWECSPSVSSARTSLLHTAAPSPSAVLIDLETSAAAETLEFLSDLASCHPDVPAVVLTSRGALTDRVEVARRGGRGFFPKSLPPGQCVEEALALLERIDAARTHVLAVDDDPAVLKALQAVLVPRGIRFTGLSDPLRFWEALETSLPDLVLLDVEMPSVNGIELCRVLRSAPPRAGIPVIFLTAHSDPATVHRVFASGADDFVAKPIVGPELATRIANRLERTHLLRHRAETDPVTGLANRFRSTRALQDFLSLADRHGQPMGLAALEIDGLKQFNQLHGAAAGDQALRWLGDRLRHEFRSEEITARWGGNDFVVGLYGLDRHASLRRVESVVRGLAARSIDLPGGQKLGITLSGGVAAYPEDAHDLEGLRLMAAEARRCASAAGGNRLLAGHALPGRDGASRADVAVVTGDEAVASLLLNAFESSGYHARALRNGLMAARTLSGPDRSLRARAIVLDLDLPGLDGLTLLKALASEGVLNETRAILLTSPSVGREAATALELGAADHVSKPLDVPVVVQRVRQVLESTATHAA
jgi:diguanylate cyclase (GGDEF)-like protein